MTIKDEPSNQGGPPKAPPVRASSGRASTGKPGTAKGTPRQADTAKASTAKASTAKASTAQVSRGEAGGPTPPRTIRIAVRLMYAGAALTAVGLALSVIAVVTGEKALRASHPHATVAQLHATQHVLITVAVFSGVLEMAAWLLLARANRGGLKWARIVATVLFAFNTVNLVGHLHGTATIGNSIYSVAIWLVGLATIVLLWLRESSAYFAS